MLSETRFVSCVKLRNQDSASENSLLRCEVAGPHGQLIRIPGVDLLLHVGRTPYSGKELLAGRARDLASELSARGPACFQTIDEPFVAVAWEPRFRRLTLAREPGGRNCLYYAVLGDSVFASNNLPLLLAESGVQPELSIQAYDFYWGLGFVPAPYCIFNGIHKVAPGTAVTIDQSGVRTVSFLTLPEAPGEECLDSDAVIDELEVRLARSLGTVTAGMDRVCLLLSGGIDSSLLGSLLARSSGSDIIAASVATGADDSVARAERAASLLGLPHQRFELPAFSFERLAAMVEQLDEPLADSMCYPLTHLLEAVSSSVDLCISGIGADSLFAGLNTHLATELYSSGGRVERRRA